MGLRRTAGGKGGGRGQRAAKRKQLEVGREHVERDVVEAEGGRDVVVAEGGRDEWCKGERKEEGGREQ